MQILTIVTVVFGIHHSQEDTNTDRGNSRGQFWYSMVNINVLFTTEIVNYCFIVFREILMTCIAKTSLSIYIPLLRKMRVVIDVTAGDVS